MNAKAQAGRCPACGGVSEAGGGNPWLPFCSERCRLADLGQWFAGRYAIPVEEESRVPPEDPLPRQ